MDQLHTRNPMLHCPFSIQTHILWEMISNDIITLVVPRLTYRPNRYMIEIFEVLALNGTYTGTLRCRAYNDIHNHTLSEYSRIV